MKALSVPIALLVGSVWAASVVVGEEADGVSRIFDPGALAPRDSTLKVEPGQEAPDFTLTSVDGKLVRLSQYRGKQHVVMTFVPAAWTPVCSAQWPGYNLAEPLFRRLDAALIGITVDNRPTLHAWLKDMGGLWFPVLSDFYPHGKVADTYGVLRSDGTTERALIVVDKQGVIRYIDVHDINKRPPLDELIAELKKLQAADAAGQ